MAIIYILFYMSNFLVVSVQLPCCNPAQTFQAQFEGAFEGKMVFDLVMQTFADQNAARLALGFKAGGEVYGFTPDIVGKF